jgi:hypothetical protein
VVHPDSSRCLFTGGMGPSSVSYVPTVSRSTDAGGTWTRSPLTAAGQGYALCIAFARSGDLAYTAGHVGTAGVVFSSTDLGDTWVQTATGPPDTVYALAVHPDSAAQVFAATPSGLFHSTDAGATWSVTLDHDTRAVLFRPGAPDTVVAGGNEGAFVSGDGGGTWQETNAGLEPPSVVALAFAGTGTATLFCGTDGGACYRASELTGLGQGSDVCAMRRERGVPSIVHGTLLLSGGRQEEKGVVWLLDATGRNLMTLAPGPNDVRHLGPGVYFIRRGRSVDRTVLLR